MSISPNPKNMQDDDFELIQAINAGQSELFHELLRRYERKLYNFGMRMCRDVQDSEDMEGFSTTETAQVLGLTTENIKVRLHRARLFLREKLKGYYDHGA
jgi:DNA-directed RNA polymerase specialized sigma24 family protein